MAGRQRKKFPEEYLLLLVIVGFSIASLLIAIPVALSVPVVILPDIAPTGTPAATETPTAVPTFTPTDTPQPLAVWGTDAGWQVDGEGPAMLVDQNCIPGLWVASLSPAHWIWSSTCVAGDTEHHKFSKNFVITKPFDSASLEIAVDNYAFVTINNDPLPNSCTNQWATAVVCDFGSLSVIDITTVVRVGRNSITVDVYNGSSGATGPWDNPAGFMALLKVR